jgi:hypothetical protein
MNGILFLKASTKLGGKVVVSFTCKSLTSELPHHKFVVAKSCFLRFHPST